MKCSKCGRNVADHLKACMYCGTPVVPLPKCPKCQRTLAEGAASCQYCGAALGKGPDLVTCPKCNRKLAAHLQTCQYCGTALPGGARPAAPAAPAPSQRDPREELMRALQALQEGRVNEALPVVERLAATPNLPNREMLFFFMGGGLLKAKRIDEAICAYQQCIAIAPQFSSGWVGYGDCLLAENDLEGALHCAKKAVELSAKDQTAFFLHGECLRRLGRNDEAIAAYRRAVEIEPRYGWAWREKAWLEDAAQDHAAAIASFAKYVSLKSDDPAETIARAQQRLLELLAAVESPGAELHSAICQCAQALQKSEKFSEAAQLWEKALKIKPSDGSALTDFGNCLLQLKRHAEALTCFDKAIALDAEDTVALLAKSVCLEAMGRVIEAAASMGQARSMAMLHKGQEALKTNKADEALARANEALRENPKLNAARELKATALERLERIPEAFAAYEEALKADPSSLKALRGRGSALLRMNRFPEALACFEQCLARDAEDKGALFYLPVALEKLGHKVEALEGYGKFLMVAPDSAKQEIQYARQQQKAIIDSLRPANQKPAPSRAGALIDKAMELLRHGQLQPAVDAFKQATATDPGAITAWLNMGVCLQQLGRADEALDVFDKAVKLAPHIAAGWLMRGTCLADKKRHAEALECYNKAIEILPYETSAWQNKGACLNALGRPQDAQPCFERAVLLDPYNIFAWYNKGCTEKNLEQREAAIRSLKKFMALAPQQLEDQIESAKGLLRELETGEKAEPAVQLTLPAKPIEAIGTRYEVYKVLGEGGFGKVYLAVMRGTDEVCALKTFLDERSADRESIELFKKEAQTWIELDRHPHLVRAYHVDEINGRLYIAVELVTGPPDGYNTLEGYLKHRPPALPQSLRWAIQFCYGMEYACSKGLRCHRDIKPANIMIDWRKQLKISDFGLAGAAPKPKAGATPQLNLQQARIGLSLYTSEGGGSGTPTHMPPEQWRSNAACDQRSDIYAFGVTLYQMASAGKLPFLPPLPRSNSPQERARFMVQLFEFHCDAPVPALDSPLAPIIRKCLGKTPQERYQSFRELRADLEPLLKGATQGEVVPAPQIGELEVSELFRKAMSFDVLNRMDDALRLYDQAIAADPDYTDAWAGKGLCLSRMKREAEALACFDMALAIDPRHETALDNKGGSLFALERPEEALVCFDRTLTLNPQDAIALSNKALCLSKLQRFDEAEQCFAKSLELEPHRAAGWHNKGEFLRSRGRFEEALGCFERALKLNPSYAQSWHLLGNCRQQMGQLAEALDCFERTLQFTPDDADALTNKGSCLASMNRLDEAMACFDRVLKLSQKSLPLKKWETQRGSAAVAMAWNNKGDIFVREQQFDKALECFDQALAVDPKLTLALRNKALRVRDLGRTDEALALLDRGLKVDPQETGCWYFKGDTLKRLKQFESAAACFMKVVEHEKANRRAISMALYHAGDCLRQLGRVVQAAPLFNDALKIDPSYQEARQALEECRALIQPKLAQPQKAAQEFLQQAHALCAQRKFQEALPLFHQAVMIDPNNTAAWSDMGKTFGILGIYDKSMECLQRALQLAPDSYVVWLNKALCEDESGRSADALASYKRFLELAPPQAEKQLAHARNRIAELSVEST